MVVSRRDVENALAASESQTCAKVVQELDKALTERWQGPSATLTVSLSINKPLRQAARFRLVALYRDAGWDIRFEEHDDQKDGYACCAHVTAFQEPESNFGQGR